MVPAAIEGLDGVMEMETRVAAVMVRVVWADVEPETAVMVAEPTELAVARPVALIDAAEDDVLQVTELVRFCCEPSLKYPVAVNCCVVPAAIEGSFGETEIEDRVAGEMLTFVELLLPP